MSDFYENRDYNFDDDSGDRRRRQKRRNRYRYDDDAWGAAHSADMADGDAADLEDWAAGMEYEEARRYRERRREDDREEDLDEIGDLSVSRNFNSSRNSRGRSSGAGNRMGDGSSALDRANRLRERYSRQNLRTGATGPRRIEGAVDEQDTGGGGDFFDALFNFDFQSGWGPIPYVVMGLILMIMVIGLTCVTAAWYSAEYIRMAMGWAG